MLTKVGNLSVSSVPRAIKSETTYLLDVGCIRFFTRSFNRVFCLRIGFQFHYLQYPNQQVVNHDYLPAFAKKEKQS